MKVSLTYLLKLEVLSFLQGVVLVLVLIKERWHLVNDDGVVLIACVDSPALDSNLPESCIPAPLIAEYLPDD